MSSKKTSPTPDDLFRSIPPAEEFHAFPALDAFPAEAIAFLTGRRATPAPLPAAPAAQPETASPFSTDSDQTPSLSVPENLSPTKPHSRPLSQPLSQSKGQSQDRSASRKATRTASQKASHSASHTDYLSQDHTQDHTSDLTTNQTPNLSQDHSQGRTQGSPSPADPGQRPRPPIPAAPEKAAQGAAATPDAAGSFSPATAADSAPAVPGRAPQAQTPLLAAFSQSLADPGPAARLNANQRRVLLFLLSARPYIITFSQIAAATGMGEASARTILRRLAVLDFLTFKKARDGNLQGVRMAFNQELCQAFRQAMEHDPVSHTLNHTQNQSPPHSPSHTLNHSLGQPLGQPVTRPDSQPATLSPLFQKEGKESILPGEQPENETAWIAEWSDDFLAFLWPKTYAVGFRMDHVRRAAATRQTLGKPLERDLVRLSLDRCEWEIENLGDLNDLKSGEKVRNPQAYLFMALSKWGILRPHPDYVSREEELVREAARELSSRKEAARQMEDAHFAAWRDGLDSTAQEEVMRGFPGGPRDVWIKNYWKKHVCAAQD
jgi:hypothetical protein